MYLHSLPKVTGTSSLSGNFAQLYYINCVPVVLPSALSVLHAVHLRLYVPDAVQPAVHVRALPRARRHRPALAAVAAHEVIAPN